MSNMARNHKDNVFCLLYRERKNLLSLYNAVNNTSYEKEEELEVVTLEEAFCMKVKNDAAFVVDSRLNLCEQQSSANPNMALRNLYYVAEELKKIAPPGMLYRRKQIKIPAPRFIVFYNGVEEQPEEQVYWLSELFEREEAEPELELKVTVININPGYSRELLEKCESLRGYMSFVEKARKKRDAGLGAEEAVRQAVDECVSENILAEFFGEHRKEIVEMGVYDFDQELYERLLREDSEEIGMEKGIEIGRGQGIEIGRMDGDRNRLVTQICKKLRLNQSVEKIAEDLVEELSVIEPICNAAKEFAPDYDCESVLKRLDAHPA
ncbi:MAG: transposase [Roseburia sp.]|nr:transposase [Roseburia sp.]MCM1099138.1 transposase [Ruminococcus flavefaciens]